MTGEDAERAAERAGRPAHAGAPRVRPAIGKINRGLPSQRCSDPLPAEVVRGFEQFNRGEFFEQHETLEDVWIEETDPIRYLYQGILQVGVGLHHLQHGNLRGAAGMLTKGLTLLEPFRPACCAVDVERFVQESSAVLAAVLRLEPHTLREFDRSLIPQVHYRLDLPSADVDAAR